MQTQYIDAVALAAQADALGIDYFNSAEWHNVLQTLARLESQANEINENLNPFGFNDITVPLYDFDQLIALARQFQSSAADDEQLAELANVNFEQNADALRQQLLGIQTLVNNTLFELCGDDIDACNGGAMAQNWHDMQAAALAIELAQQRSDQVYEKIGIEQDLATTQINIIMRTGEQLAALAWREGVVKSHTVVYQATTTAFFPLNCSKE